MKSLEYSSTVVRIVWSRACRPVVQPGFVQNAVGWAVLALGTVGRIDCLGYRVKGDEVDFLTVLEVGS